MSKGIVAESHASRAHDVTLVALAAGLVRLAAHRGRELLAVLGLRDALLAREALRVERLSVTRHKVRVYNVFQR